MTAASAGTVFLAALVTALATGLGALPFLFAPSFSRWWLGISNAIAGGLMLAASHNLIAEGARIHQGRVLLGMLIGLAAIVLANRLIARRDSAELAEIGGTDPRKAFLIMAVMTAHSFAEGLSVGVSFAGAGDLGLVITTAIAIHNIPEGLAISLVLVPRGASVGKAAVWSIFSSLPQPLMAVPAFLFVLAFAPFLPIALGIAAGAMIWMVFAELVPDAIENADAESVGAAVVLAVAGLWAFQHFVLGHW